jgi:hypothetical protein
MPNFITGFSIIGYADEADAVARSKYSLDHCRPRRKTPAEALGYKAPRKSASFIRTARAAAISSTVSLVFAPFASLIRRDGPARLLSSIRQRVHAPA